MSKSKIPGKKSCLFPKRGSSFPESANSPARPTYQGKVVFFDHFWPFLHLTRSVKIKPEQFLLSGFLDWAFYLRRRHIGVLIFMSKPVHIVFLKWFSDMWLSLEEAEGFSGIKIIGKYSKKSLIRGKNGVKGSF